MKKYTFLAIFILAIFSVNAQNSDSKVLKNKPNQQIDGKTLFNKNSCNACHHATLKTVGPSIKEISEAYAGKKDEMVKFLKGEAPAIVDPPSFAIMKPQITEVLNKMSDKEIEALADYMLTPDK